MKQFESIRVMFLAALLLCAPAVASAQLGGDEAPARLTVSAYTGVRAPFGGGVASVFVPSGGFVVRQDRTGSPLLGVDAKLHLRGRVSLLAGGLYTQTGQVQYFLTDTTFSQGPDWISESTDPMWFGKLGLSARFEAPRSITDTRRRPSTDLFAAAAVVREFDELHPALNLGFQGSLPMARGVGLVVGIEDYLVFWDQERLAPNVAGIVQGFQEEEVQDVVLHYSTSNIIQLHLGVSLKAW
jgi:hypothetical protein